MGRDEVFHHGQPFAEGGTNGQVNDAAGGVNHEAAHTCHLGDLADVTLGAADGHEIHAAVLVQVVLNQFLHLVCGVTPDGDGLTVAFLFSYEPQVELLLNLVDRFVGGGEQLLFLLRHFEVVHGDGDAGLGGVLEAGALHTVDHVGGAIAV